MNIIENIKYRWRNGCPPLPGQFEPIDYPEGSIRVKIILSDGKDREKFMFLRRIRGLLGYGEGWTLLEATAMTVLEYSWLILCCAVIACFYYLLK
jgi:hypothetical protein